jgi:L-glutamine-phosphate cytidylyltransferase
MTRALILAAGQGTRLRPLTNNKPKCMVPLLGTPLLQRQIDTLKACGVHDIHVAAGYRADQIQACGVPITINKNFASTNMVETLFCALPFVEQEGDLIISYGDIVYHKSNLEAVLSCKEEIGIMVDSHWLQYWKLRLEDPLEDAETLILDENNYVKELGKKPQSYENIQGQYTGLIKVSSKSIPAFVKCYQALDRSQSYDGREFQQMYMTSFLQSLIDIGWKVKAVQVQNGWLEVDSCEDLKLYESLAKENRLKQFCKLD